MRKTAKEEMLTRIRTALANAPEPPDIPRDFREQDERDHMALVEDFVDRLKEYKAIVTLTNGAGLSQAIADACQKHALRRLVVPADVPDQWLPAEVTVLRDDPPLTLTDLDTSSGVLTGCALGIAQTGTILLDAGALQGRRVLSLLPDVHLCVIRAEQIVGLVPEAVEKLAEQPTRPLTLISGPSATSDIELSRVEGVHGPRTLHVLVMDDQ
jgi:L-lactate dehydrogenase complex protein LldG